MQGLTVAPSVLPTGSQRETNPSERPEKGPTSPLDLLALARLRTGSFADTTPTPPLPGGEGEEEEEERWPPEEGPE
eukprot:5007084-Pyramimonas_sp.AAC.2